jgi:hypothetical protein
MKSGTKPPDGQEDTQTKLTEETDFHPESDVVSLDEFDEFSHDQDVPNNASSNDGGIYPPEEAFDQDAPNYEAGTPGHPGIDEGTA